MSTPENQEQIQQNSPQATSELESAITATPSAEAEVSPGPTLNIIPPGETSAAPDSTPEAALPGAEANSGRYIVWMESMITISGLCFSRTSLIRFKFVSQRSFNFS